MKKIIACFTLAGLLALPVMADEAISGQWQYTFTPYAWLANLDGTVGIGPVEVSVEEDFSDLLKNITMAAMLRGEAHNGRWGLFADMVYIELSEDQTTPSGEVELELDQWMVSFGGMLRVADSETLVADIGAGLRLFDSAVEIRTPGPDASDNVDWIDPLITGRVRMPMASNCFLVLDGEIGGFGTESDLVWQLTAAAGYSVSDRFELLIGYRYLDYDYEKDLLVYDLATSGLALGLNITF